MTVQRAEVKYTHHGKTSGSLYVTFRGGKMEIHQEFGPRDTSTVYLTGEEWDFLETVRHQEIWPAPEVTP